MGDDCKDCAYVSTLDERLKNLEIKVGMCEDNFDTRIHELEKHIAVSDEKFKQIFEKLDKIIMILDKQADRIPNFVWGVAGAVLTGVLMWAFKF